MRMLALTLILLLPLLATGERFTVWVRTADRKHAGTDEDVRITIQENGGSWWHLGLLDDHNRDDNEQNSLNSFTFDKDIPDWMVIRGLSCIVLHIGGDDAWLVQSVSVSNRRFYDTFTNDRQIWLSTDTSEGTSMLTLCK